MRKESILLVAENVAVVAGLWGGSGVPSMKRQGLAAKVYGDYLIVNGRQTRILQYVPIFSLI